MIQGGQLYWTFHFSKASLVQTDMKLNYAHVRPLTHKNKCIRISKKNLLKMFSSNCAFSWIFILQRGHHWKFIQVSCTYFKVAGDKGISKTKSKQQSQCSNCMHQPVMSWGNACSTCMHRPVRCMHRPVMSQADVCSYCMGSVILISSQIYLYSSYFAPIW